MKRSTENGPKMADKEKLNGSGPPNKKMITETPPGPKSLKKHCSQNGISLRRVARANRQYVGSSGVYWDNFSPPSGYINDDDSFSQERCQDDEADSPANFLTKSSDRHALIKPRRTNFDPNFNLDEFFPLPTDSSGSTEGSRTEDMYTDGHNDGENDAFVDDELSDSLICSLSQQAEEEYDRIRDKLPKDTLDEETEIVLLARNSNNLVIATSTPNVPIEDAVEENMSSTPINPASRRGGRTGCPSVRRRLDLIPAERVVFGDMDEDDDMDSILSLIDIP